MMTVLSRKIVSPLLRYGYFFIWACKSGGEKVSLVVPLVITIGGTFLLVTENQENLFRYLTDYFLFFFLYPLALYLVFEAHRDYFWRGVR